MSGHSLLRSAWRGSFEGLVFRRCLDLLPRERGGGIWGSFASVASAAGASSSVKAAWAVPDWAVGGDGEVAGGRARGRGASGWGAQSARSRTKAPPRPLPRCSRHAPTPAQPVGCRGSFEPFDQGPEGAWGVEICFYSVETFLIASIFFIALKILFLRLFP